MSAAFNYDANLANVLNDPERLKQRYDPYEDPDNYTTGESEVLTPIEYLERGHAVLEANRIAINNTPHQDVAYPDWNIRYGMETVLTELGVEYEGNYWSRYSLSSKEVVNPANKEKYQYLWSANVAEIYASAKFGTFFTLNQWADADLDNPDMYTPRLWNSELLFQAWRDACYTYVSPTGGDVEIMHPLQMQKLKYVIIAPISNVGTYTTICDALKIKGLSIADNKYNMVTFSCNDISTASAEFAMLMGTTNARPVVRMLADHVESLGAKRVVKIHAWLSMPQFECPMLVFELAGEDPPAPTPAPTPAPKPMKISRKIGTKVQSLMKKFQN
ncbi:uncharacterized protein EAE97_006411 [Botrytis byssoidea]|uniref:Uncharacterized protein n=1 Tax=Botrytis byssoidea TaxID=139641 RepID=A0A9P5IJ64_9HELO|nr:uncharacterized protein EAE97_006411 [Botrytis byssoidea]KAF7942957.1 hypothetical protein EAE97_006411 [Botrytis byssoidea]